jgi:hypothetical protein
MTWRALGSSGLENGPVAGSFERGNKPTWVHKRQGLS